MDGMTFGELMNALAEPDTRFLSSGLTPTIGPTVVGHTDNLQSAPNVEGQLQRVPRDNAAPTCPGSTRRSPSAHVLAGFPCCDGP